MQNIKVIVFWGMLWGLVNVKKLMNILKTALFIVLVQNILKLIALSFFSIKFAT